jgi:alpha-glucosidase
LDQQARQAFTCTAADDAVSLRFGAREGTYAPWWKTVDVVIYDWPSAQADAHLTGSGTALKTSYDAGARALHVMMPDTASAGELRITGATPQ